MPDKDKLLAIRNAIADNPKGFRRIVEAKKFKETFKELHGDSLKTAPKGFPKDHEAIEYLRMKSFTVARGPLKNTVVNADDFVSYAGNVFKTMKPLIDFLREV